MKKILNGVISSKYVFMLIFNSQFSIIQTFSMKKILYISLIISLLAGLSACKNFLEIPPQDPASILVEDAFKTKNDFQKLLTSCYDAARSNTYYGGRLVYASDFMADDIDGSLFTGDWASVYGHRTSTFIPITSEIWQDPYLVVYRCNSLEELMNTLTIPDLTAADKERMLGEARFLRALTHFEIVRLYGQPVGGGKDNDIQSGIPIRLVPDQSKIVRSTTQEVYAQVLSDLDAAIAKLPETNGIYADKWAAKGMKAKVLFQMNRNDEALALLEEIINSSGKTLNTDLTKRYAVAGDAGNTEVVFGLLSAKASLSEMIDSYAKRPSAGISLTEALLNETKVEPNDIRDSLWLEVKNAGTPIQRIQSNKFKYFSGRECVLPILHLTELTLMRAEINALKGSGDAALGDLNKIRTRANLLPYTSTVQNALVTEIRHQRRIEMFGEGNRLHDLKRIGAFYQPDLLIRTSPWDCPGMILQIPNSEAAGNLDIMFNEQGGCE